VKQGDRSGWDTPIEVWMSLKVVVIILLTMLFKRIFRSNKMSDEWRWSILVPIFKNKGIYKVVLIIEGLY
jgi:hypothetical protein